MELTALKKESMSDGPDVVSDSPEYPWGTEITLRDENFDAFGLGSYSVGDTVMIVAKAKVTEKSVREHSDSKDSKSADLQITEMKVSPDEGKNLTDKLYGSD